MAGQHTNRTPTDAIYASGMDVLSSLSFVCWLVVSGRKIVEMEDSRRRQSYPCVYVVGVYMS